jgi:FtsP/CotA-like multicopper oxidase with cupredoxin domain
MTSVLKNADVSHTQQDTHWWVVFGNSSHRFSSATDIRFIRRLSMETKRISRRDFIKATSWGAAAGYLGLNGRAAFGMHGGTGIGGGGGTIIDPPVGGRFKDPLEMPCVRTGNLVEVNLMAKTSPINITGTIANLMTYNGSYPGPTIGVRQGDILRIHLTNALPATTQTNLLGYQQNITNLHTHGWHVSPKPPGDYVMYDLPPGQTYIHEYDTALQEAGTLNFYHPHKHGVAAEQYWAGLVGALVVEDSPDLPTNLSTYETHIIILKDITLSGSEPAAHAMMGDYMHGKEGNLVMVNGQVNPRLTIKSGQVQRWRILNASNARFYRLSLESHSMYLIGTDGGLLDRPYQVSELLLSPGERVDVLVRASQRSASYRLRALPYNRIGMMTSPTITLLTLSYSGKLSQSLPSSINPAARRLDPDALDIRAERTLTLGMGQGNASINGQNFDLDPYTIMSEVDTYELWTIVNESGMDHPFHQHVNATQVLAVSGVDPGYAALYTNLPTWKDVVLVPKWGSVTMLVPVMDYGGMAMFHCHILEHEDIGMMGIWHLMGMEM